MKRHFWSALFLLSYVFASGCTVGSTYSENNQNANNANNANNTNNTNNVNNTNNNTNDPSDVIKGNWRVTAVDTVVDTVDGTALLTLTNNPQPVTLAGGGQVTLAVIGNFQFNKLGAAGADLTAILFMPVNNLLNRVPEAPPSSSVTVTAGTGATEVVLGVPDGGETVTWRATRTGDNLELVYESTTATDPYAGPSRFTLVRVGETPSVFATAGTLDNVSIRDTNGNPATLSTDVWTMLADGYYYREGSSWTASPLGIYSWHTLWTYANDDQGADVVGTLDVPRPGYLFDDGLGTLRFYFYAFDGTGTDRAVTLHATVSSLLNIHAFTVTACVDSASAGVDLACSGREFPTTFDIEVE